MEKPTRSSNTPLFFHSKLLCSSFLYLLTSIILAIFTSSSFSSTKCLFKPPFPFQPIQSHLFTYNISYGEHKHAIPTTRSSCNSPYYFSDYRAAVEEIQELCDGYWRTTLGSRNLRYMKAGNGEGFGGKFSIKERVSYFDHRDDGIEVPCGRFFKHFPVSESDRNAMERCDGVVVVSAIFNDHDKIRQPRGLGSKTLDHVCFFMLVDDITLKGLEYHNLIPKTPSSMEHIKIGAWRIVNVSLHEDLYNKNAAILMSGMIPKYLVHRLFPNTKYSIWIDAKLQLVVDPLLLIHSLVVKEGVDMAMSRHPFFVHTMEEVIATARWKKWWDVDGLRKQIESYCENGLEPWSPMKPYPSDGQQANGFLS